MKIYEIEIRPEQQKAAENYLQKMAQREVQVMNFVMPYEISKRFRSFMLIESDLKFMKKASEQLILLADSHPTDETVLSCIWQAIATTYGKIFTKSQSGFTSLEKSWFKGEQTYISAHDTLMAWRNKFVAHREDSDHEMCMAFIKITKQGSSPETKTYDIKALAKVMPTIDEVRSFIFLFDFLLDQMPAKIDSEATQVMENFYKQGREFMLHHLIDENQNPIAS